jgi:uncharacterized protein YceH (UPF0502 family)
MIHQQAYAEWFSRATYYEHCIACSEFGSFEVTAEMVI